MKTPEDLPIDDGSCDDVLDPDMADLEFEGEMMGIERNDRAWLRTLYPYIELALKPNQAEVHVRVRHAINDAAIAAAERVARLCRADVAEPHGDLDDPCDDA